MILYVNGDSHAAAAEAVSPAAFAEDAGYPELGRLPHPDNLAVSWGQQLADLSQLKWYCDAESASSNYRIERTTRAWMERLRPWESAVVVIGWSTWEREEWLIDDVYYQVGGSGTDSVPIECEQRYKQFVTNINWHQCQSRWHQRIWKLHLDLVHRNIPHVFFNCNNYFDQLSERYDWGTCYLDPYSAEFTYDRILRHNGFETISPESWHFGKEAHCFWAKFVLQYLIRNQMINVHAIPTD